MPGARYKIPTGRMDRHSSVRATAGFVLLLLCLALGGYIYCIRVIQTEPCATTECVATANRLLSSLKPEIDPCEDFYEHACGNAAKNAFSRNSSPAQLMEYQMATVLEDPDEVTWKPLELQKQFYSSCVNTEYMDELGFSNIELIVDKLGGWPVVAGPYWRQIDVEELHEISWVAGLPVDILLHIVTEENGAIVIKAPVLRDLPDMFIESIYMDLMVDMAMRFGASRIIAEKDLSYVLEFEKGLLKILRRASIGYDTVSKEDLSKILPQFNISGILENTFFSDATYVSWIKANIPFLKDFNLLLAGTSSRTIANFYVWKVIQNFHNFLPSPARENFINFDRIFNKEEESLSVLCLHKARQMFPGIIEKTIKEHESFEGKAIELEHVVDRIKNTFSSRIRHAIWIDDETKSKLQTTVNNIIVSIAEPESAEDVDILSAVLEDFNFSSTNIIEMILQMNTLYRLVDTNRTIQGIQENYDEYTSLRQVSYSPEKNLIQIPMSFLYETNQLKYVTYGTLGTLIAHFIAHSINLDVRFNENSSSSESEGDYPTTSEDQMLWNNETWHQLYARFTCIDEQFFNETNLDESNEIVADIIGIDVAYEAYINWLSGNSEEETLPGLSYLPKQLFWISFASKYCRNEAYRLEEAADDRHSANKFKSMKVLIDSLYFSADFGCKTGSEMNPVDKCYVL